MMDAGTLYLIIGAALIFGACAYAAKRILRQLTLKQIGIISVITIVTIAVIWGLVSLSSRKQEPGREFNQPTPSLQSSPD
jgi:hypothetical protein